MADIIWYENNMTSNTLPIPLVASASSIISAAYQPWRAFNGTYSGTVDAWHSASTTSAWLQLDFGVSTPISTFKLRGRPGANPETAPNTFKLLGSNDGRVFHTVFDISGVTWVVNDEKIFTLPSTVSYRYYRLDTIKPTSGTYVIIGTLQFGNEDSTRLLVRNGSSYYSYVSNQWEALGETPSEATIMDKGMSVVSGTQIAEFEGLYGLNWKPVQWTKNNLATESTLYATPYSQILTAKNSVQLTGVVSGIFKWTATGGSRVALSVDEGVTYHAFKNGAWVDVTNDMANAMTATEYSSLTWVQYELLKGESNFLKHQYYIPDNSVVDDILITTELMGENKLASTNDFSLSYKQESKTIQISISKSGSYFCNYIDV